MTDILYKTQIEIMGCSYKKSGTKNFKIKKGKKIYNNII